jgi:hypothetical protein
MHHQCSVPREKPNLGGGALQVDPAAASGSGLNSSYTEPSTLWQHMSHSLTSLCRAAIGNLSIKGSFGWKIFYRVYQYISEGQ